MRLKTTLNDTPTNTVTPDIALMHDYTRSPGLRAVAYSFHGLLRQPRKLIDRFVGASWNIVYSN